MDKYKIFLLIILANFLFTPLLLAKDYDLAAEELFAFGKAYLQQQRYADAKRELKKCLMLDPNHIQAKRLLELCENKLKEEVMLLALDQTEQKMALSKEKGKEVVEKITPKEKTQVSIPLEEKFPFLGGAFGIPKGHCLLELYSRYYYHNSQFDSKGKKKRWAANGKGYEIEQELKIDYGASKNITLWVHIPYKESHWKDDNGKLKTKGLADIWVGGKYRFLNEPLVLSLQLAAKFPAGYDKNDSPSLGNEQIDQEIMLLSAKPFWDLYYFRAESGYRWRYKKPADVIPYYFELGYHPLTTPFDRLLFKGALDGVESIRGSGEIENYTKWLASVLFTLKKGVNPYLKTEDKLELELGYGKTFLGKNTSAASEIFTKILYYF